MDSSHSRAAGTERCFVRLRVVASIAIAMTLLAATRVPATSIDPLSWEELVTGADFVGVVECKTAGGIVAKYEVIESWKGMEAGKILSILVEPDIAGPQFSIALCGERYLIAAHKTTAGELGGMRTVPFPQANPLWWRELPVDLKTPLFQGWVRVIPDREIDLIRFGSAHASLDEFRNEALKLLALPHEQQEDRVLRAVFSRYYDRRLDAEGRARLEGLRSKVQRAAGAAQLVDLLVSDLSGGAKEGRRAISTTLARGGGLLTLKAMEKLLAEGRPLDREVREYVIPSIYFRLGTSMPGEVPTQATRQLLFRGWEGTVEHLVRADYTDERMEPDRGYKDGSQFALYCTTRREEQFTKLLSAKDPFIRVTGAVYLCFENRNLGMEKLREFMHLEGDPGAWAALNLVRRGDKTAVERALEIFATNLDRGREGQTHRHLQDRLLVLLSNSANRSGLPQPGRPEADGASRARGGRYLHAQYLEWWKTHEARAILFDPWLELLEKQKVD